MKNTIRNKNELNQFIASHLPKVIVETYLCRIGLYLKTLISTISAVMLAMIALNYVMMVGNNFNAPEYHWLAIASNVVMYIIGIALLSKITIHRLQPLYE